MTMITPSYLGETIEYSSLHACRSTLEDPTHHAERATGRSIDAIVALMAASEDYYRLLQVHPSADDEVIHAAYRALAQKNHPDAGGSKDAMADLNRAAAPPIMM